LPLPTLFQPEALKVLTGNQTANPDSKDAHRTFAAFLAMVQA
jgi:hypothetical protein